VPCYRCGVRQTDPERGKSPWRRGVVHDQLVLVCPACQESADWTAELERCAKCRSAHLIRRLGQVECLDCGLVREPEALLNPGLDPGLNPGLDPGLNPGLDPGLVAVGGPDAAGRPSAGLRPSAGGRPSGPADNALADEVSRALDRLLGRA
jgi:hypothetical protein